MPPRTTPPQTMPPQTAPTADSGAAQLTADVAGAAGAGSAAIDAAAAATGSDAAGAHRAGDGRTKTVVADSAKPAGKGARGAGADGRAAQLQAADTAVSTRAERAGAAARHFSQSQTDSDDGREGHDAPDRPPVRVSLVDKTARGQTGGAADGGRATAAGGTGHGGRAAQPSPTQTAVTDGAINNQRHENGIGLEQRTEGAATRTVHEFRQFLDREAAPSIVRHARFVFHNNQESEIRILLKPAELGVMRLKLFMHNNTIHGKILVDNPFAKEVVQNGIADIQRTIRNQGLEGGAIDVDVNPHSQSEAHKQPYVPAIHRHEQTYQQHIAAEPATENNTIYAHSMLINLYA